jgi:hypothetical protein
MELYGYAAQFHAWSAPGARDGSSDSDIASLIYDGTSHLDQIGFWAAYLADTYEYPEVIVEALGMSLLEVESAQEALLQQPEAWPAFTVPLPRGLILIVCRTETSTELGPSGEWIPSDKECGTDFWLADADPGLLLAEISGHQWGPGLSWPELRAIANIGAPDRLAIARRLLLLVPALGDAGAGKEAVAWVAQALTLVAGRDGSGEIGARARHDFRAAAQVIVEEHSYFPPAEWRSEDGVRTCDSELSVRNPLGDRPLPAREMRRVSEALPYS